MGVLPVSQMAPPRVLLGRRGAAARGDPAPNIYAEWAALPHAVVGAVAALDVGEYHGNFLFTRLRFLEIQSHLYVGESLAEPVQPRESQADSSRDL